MTDDELSLYVYEHVICKHYGWSLEDVRNLDLQDFYIHLRICMARESADKDFQAMLAGATEGDNAPTSEPRVTGQQRLPSGAIKQSTQEKAVHVSSKLKRVRVDKDGNYLGDA